MTATSAYLALGGSAIAEFFLLAAVFVAMTLLVGSCDP